MFEFPYVWVLVGFFAQLIGGALGIAYGVSSTTALVSLGIYPVIANASVHTAQIFATFASGSFHFKLGNVRRDMLLSLAIPGILGGVTGAYVCATMSSKPLRSIVGIILFCMGIMILYRFAFKRVLHFRTEKPSYLTVLGYAAAFVDALGGGGWGPIATTTLMANDVEPSKAIGSINFTKIFVTISVTLTFLILLGPEMFMWEIILGLIVGGLICAPVAALICKKLPHRLLGTLVGATVILLSIRMMYMHIVGT